MNTHHLLPTRNDIQGALEHAYHLLRHRTDQPAPDKAEHWAVQGSLTLGPILWLANTYNRTDLIAWISEPPTQQQAQSTYAELTQGTTLDEDLNNVRRRLQPFLDQDTATAKALAQWLPTAIAEPPTPALVPEPTRAPTHKRSARISEKSGQQRFKTESSMP